MTEEDFLIAIVALATLAAVMIGLLVAILVSQRALRRLVGQVGGTAP